MNTNFNKIIQNIAECIEIVDSRKPTFKTYKPGIGPLSEPETLKLILKELKEIDSDFYKNAFREVGYPPKLQSDFNKNTRTKGNTRQACDLKFEFEDEVIFSEVKMMRYLRNNGDPEDNIFKNIFNPYKSSALYDGIKLIEGGLRGTLTIIIYGYDNEKYPLEKTIHLFETCCKEYYSISERYSADFKGLVHPVFQKGTVHGWIVSK
jgi:hypothetical protein